MDEDEYNSSDMYHSISEDKLRADVYKSLINMNPQVYNTSRAPGIVAPPSQTTMPTGWPSTSGTAHYTPSPLPEEEFDGQCAFEPKSKEDEFFNTLAEKSTAINIDPYHYADNILASELTLEFDSSEQGEMHGLITNLCNYKFMLRSEQRECRILAVVEVISASLVFDQEDYVEKCSLVFKYKDVPNEL